MPGSNLVQSLLRGLDILELLSSRTDGATPSEIANHLGCKTTTAFNLVRTLAARGFVEKHSRPVRYVLGTNAYQLARRQTTQRFYEQAEQSLLSLAALYPSATVTLCEYRANEVIIRLRVSPERPRTVEHPVDHAMSPYVSASSLVFQAFWDGQTRQNYQNRYPFAEYGMQQWKTQAALETALQECREQGYICPQVSAQRGFIISMPIFSPGNQLIAALGMRLTQEPMNNQQKNDLVVSLKTQIDFLVHAWQNEGV